MRGRAATSRRGVLRAALAVPLVPVLASCTSTPPAPPPPDPLAALAAAARADAAAADAVAAAVPGLAAPAGEMAKARSEHALALQREVDRVRPPTTSAGSASAGSAPSGGAIPPANPATAKTALLDALRAAEQKAAELVATVPRYRAGLVGSVAASCASLREVFG